MDKRRVTISIGGQPCSFYSDDPDDYIAALEQRTNAVLKETAGFSTSAYNNAVLSVISLTDQMLRTEQQGSRKSASKSAPKSAEKDKIEKGQLSVWDLLEDQIL